MANTWQCSDLIPDICIEEFRSRVGAFSSSDLGWVFCFVVVCIVLCLFFTVLFKTVANKCVRVVLYRLMDLGVLVCFFPVE